MSSIQPTVDDPWVAMVVRDDRVDTFQNANLETEHMMCTQIVTQYERIYIINIYCQYSIQIKNILTDLESVLHALAGAKVIIVMDAKARSRLWFDDEINERGKVLEELIIQFDLRILNRANNPPTFFGPRGTSNIDVTLATSNIAMRIEGWMIQDICTTSDHHTTSDNLITFNLRDPPLRDLRRHPRSGFNVARTDLARFERAVTSKFGERTLLSLGSLDVNTAARVFNRRLNEICKESMPTRGVPNRAVPWWSDELSCLRRESKAAKKQLMRVRKLRLYNLEQYAGIQTSPKCLRTPNKHK